MPQDLKSEVRNLHFFGHLEDLHYLFWLFCTHIFSFGKVSSLHCPLPGMLSILIESMTKCLYFQGILVDASKQEHFALITALLSTVCAQGNKLH